MKMFKSIKPLDYVFLCAGIVVGIIVMAFLWPSRIATLENGEDVVVKLDIRDITANDMYNNMKSKYAAPTLYEEVDKAILSTKYTISEEDEVKIRENADYYYNMYESYYNMSKDEFLESNGFSDEEDFLDYLQIDYLRRKFYDEYIESLVTDSEINSYYEESVFAPINVEHILVKTSDDVSAEDAKAKANEILARLNQGESWESVKSAYASDTTQESFQIKFTSNLEESFDTEAKRLSDGAYSSLVKTSYGYHIIYRVSTDDKPTLEEVMDDIIEKRATELKSMDEYSLEKVLVIMRSDANMDIMDTEYKSAYEIYVKNLDNKNS